MPPYPLLRLFGSGRLPAEGEQLIAGERLIARGESLRASVTLLNFSRPGKACVEPPLVLGVGCRDRQAATCLLLSPAGRECAVR